jgi:drug/metabolite transporter (DMT)-like permease
MIQPDISAAGATAVYSFFEGVLSSFWLLMIWAGERKINRKAGDGVRSRLSGATLAGIGIYLAYTLVLISMAFVTNVSYVVAFRQLSIPIGTLIGIVMLREAPDRGKLIGSAVIFCGLILVALG